jgi:hypothetical protein
MQSGAQPDGVLPDREAGGSPVPDRGWCGDVRRPSTSIREIAIVCVQDPDRVHADSDAHWALTDA